MEHIPHVPRTYIFISLAINRSESLSSILQFRKIHLKFAERWTSPPPPPPPHFQFLKLTHLSAWIFNVGLNSFVVGRRIKFPLREGHRTRNSLSNVAFTYINGNCDKIYSTDVDRTVGKFNTEILLMSKEFNVGSLGRGKGEEKKRKNFLGLMTLLCGLSALIFLREVR